MNASELLALSINGRLDSCCVNDNSHKNFDILICVADFEVMRNLFVRQTHSENMEQYHGTQAAPHSDDIPSLLSLRYDDHAGSTRICSLSQPLLLCISSNSSGMKGDDG
jgi:hypothetical protein